MMGESYQYIFIEGGIYNYLCAIHPFMKGTVEVIEKVGIIGFIYPNLNQY